MGNPNLVALERYIKEKKMGRPVRRDVLGTEVFGTYVNSNAGIRCQAYFASNQTDVYILKQVGSRRYKVVDVSAVQDESCVVGTQYIITTADTTDWKQMGAPNNNVGTWFTCKATCADPKNGVASEIRTAKLVSGTPSASGEMKLVGYTNTGHANAIAIRHLNKRTAIDWSGNRYTWRLQNDSSADYILLTPVTSRG
jgi:hypothetical protein